MRNALSLLLISLGTIAPGLRAQERVTAYTGATLIDGTGRPAIADATLLVAGERIVAVGRRAEVTIPMGARREDLRGRWIIPGMIDTHVHFWESARPGAQPTFGADVTSIFPYDAEVEWMKQRLPYTLSRYICSGVTSVIVLGAIDWEYAIRPVAERQAEAPRLIMAAGVFSNKPVTEDFPIFDGEQTGHDATNTEEALSLLDRLAPKSDLVKIGIVATPQYTWARFKPTLEALVQRAHARGLPVSVHPGGATSALESLASGADNLAHPIAVARLDTAFLAVARRRGVTVTSTIGAYVGHERLAAERFELEPTERTCGDPQVTSAWERWSSIPVADRPRIPPAYGKRQDFINRGRSSVRQMYEAGVALAVGSDGGNIGTMHGPGFQRELRILAELGVSPMDVIVAATRHGARVAGKEKELGTLEPGKLADFVVLDADPLADVANLDRVSKVHVRGRMIERKALLTMK